MWFSQSRKHFLFGKTYTGCVDYIGENTNRVYCIKFNALLMLSEPADNDDDGYLGILKSATANNSFALVCRLLDLNPF